MLAYQSHADSQVLVDSRASLQDRSVITPVKAGGPLSDDDTKALHLFPPGGQLDKPIGREDGQECLRIIQQRHRQPRLAQPPLDRRANLFQETDERLERIGTDKGYRRAWLLTSVRF